MRQMLWRGLLAACLLMPATAWAQQQSADKPAAVVDDEEQMDHALKKFGFVSGQAFQCHTKEEQAKLEHTALNVATNILRLFGSDRAFYYAAEFGAGMTEKIDPKDCAGAIKQASEMIARLKTLSAER